MANSTHKVEVFQVEHLEKHPNADTLSIMKVWDYQAVVRTSDYNVGDLCCYVPPDNVLPDKPEYSFLKSRHIKAAKLRGIMSQGLVLVAPAGSAVGDDVAELLGIVHYVPDIKNSGDGQMIADPPFGGEKYDVDSFFRYGDLIPEGTPVEITEKVDGANCRASFQDGKFWIGSRENYRQEAPGGFFWRAMHENPWLKVLCEQNPDAVVYGELFGKVQKTRYAAQGNQVFFRVFDIMTPKGYMNQETKINAIKVAVLTAKGINALPLDFNWETAYVPILYVGPYNKQVVLDTMTGPSVIPGAKNLREGCVVKPLKEMWCQEIGRLIIKAVSPKKLAEDKE